MELHAGKSMLGAGTVRMLLGVVDDFRWLAPKGVGAGSDQKPPAIYFWALAHFPLRFKIRRRACQRQQSGASHQKTKDHSWKEENIIYAVRYLEKLCSVTCVPLARSSVEVRGCG
jgi:hypothetical protein